MTSLASLVYRGGIRYRNPKILKHLAFLQKSQAWSLDELQNFQLGRLKELVEIAYAKAPHYRLKFDQAGVTPASIQHLDDLRKLPILEKNELRQNRDAIQIVEPTKKLFYSETSGSTGTPLVFFRDDDWDGWHNASVMRGYSWYGVQPWDRNGYLWGFNYSPAKRRQTRALDAVQNRFRMFSYDDQEIRRFVAKLRHATFLGGYSSMIYEIAKAINNDSSIEPLTNLKLVKGTSEKIFAHYHDASLKAFGRKITSEYGAAESGIIAFECPHGAMHVNMETCIVEVVDSEIVGTNLTSHSFPVIRYRLGDYVDYAESDNCTCGKHHPVIREVTGRIGQLIRGKTKSFPSLTLYYVFKNLASKAIVLNYQAIQEQVGELELRIEQTLSDTARRGLHRELESYFGQELLCRISENADLRSKNRKRRDFISHLDQS